MLVACAGAPTAPVSEAPTSAAPAASTAPAEPSASPDRDAGWIGDFERLVSAREEFHPDPWHGIAREEYVAAVDDVIERVPELTDDQLLVETVRLAAMPTWAGRDGHGGIYPWGEGSYGVHMLPLRLYAFSDGMFVVDALPPYRDLVGDEVVVINGHPVADVTEAVAPLVPRDNEQQVLSQAPRHLVAAEILHGLGLINDPRQPVPMTFAQAGELAVVAVPVEAYERWAGGHHSLSPPERATGPLWIRNLADASWSEWLDEAGTLYVQYNMVMGGLGSIRDEIETRTADGSLRRIVVDVRHNPGGDNTTYRPFLTRLAEAEDAGAELFAIIGRATFSAAGNFVTDLSQETDVTLVGEDLGTSPNQYGDSITIGLEHSGLVFRVAPQWIVKSDDPEDPRITIEPDIRTPLSSDDYFGDVDPAVEAILGVDS